MKIKGYKEELSVQADDVAVVGAERKANLVPHSGGDAGRSVTAWGMLLS